MKSQTSSTELIGLGAGLGHREVGRAEDGERRLEVAECTCPSFASGDSRLRKQKGAHACCD